jgi:hypothetical protein
MTKKMRIWTIVSFGVCVLASAAPLGWAQQDQWLQYTVANEAWQILGDMGAASPRLSSQKPQGVELPEFKCDEPLFARWSTPMVEAGGLWIALDRTKKGGKYDAVYVDSDADNSLADESAYQMYRQEQRETYFGPIKVVFQGEDGPITYHLNIQAYEYEQGRSLYIRSAGWYEGTVTVAGEGPRSAGTEKYCVLIDQNVNGTFNDKSLNASSADRIRIGKKDSRDTRFVGNYIEVDGVLYTTEIARDGAYIKLANAEDVTSGTVRLPEVITDFAAGGENGLFIVKPKEGAARLPVGKYRIDHWRIDRKDDKGGNWALLGRYFSGDSGLFTVAETSEAELSVGEPIISTLEATQRESEYVFAQALQGRLGERIELTREGSQPQPPKLQIKSKDGTYDRTFSFEYG